MRARQIGIVFLIGVAFSLVGCSASEPEISPSPSASPIFEGTPEEFTTLWRACIEGLGFATMDLSSGNADPGFGIDSEGRAPEEIQDANEKCWAELGDPKMQDLSEQELRERYEIRLAQYACLAENGLVSGDPPTFETFVSDYNRSGQKEIWEPTIGASTLERDGIMMGGTDVCPRGPNVW